MGYVHFVRSPYAHAKIRSIDVSKALELPGVYGTLTGDEVAILTDPFFQISRRPGAHLKDYALAVGKVRFVGEPVVAVVAETRELARDAPSSSRSSTSRSPRRRRAQALPRTRRSSTTTRRQPVWQGVYEWGDSTARSPRPTAS
jgi:2-furoyl-CoA dehydrogenase large subunit